QRVRKMPTTRKRYAEHLQKLGVIEAGEADRMVAAYRDGLDEGKNVSMTALGMVGNKYTVDWQRYVGDEWYDRVDTSISLERIKTLSQRLRDLPEGFELHKRVARILGDRGQMAAGAKPIDWGFAEHMAYASLLEDGYGVRLAGQDAGRGTFFHRHATLYNQTDGKRHVPLEQVAHGEGHARFTVLDTLLSEVGVLGYEYGYATADPDVLTIWEAQFGDFVNGAQVVIDQFISSGQAKWGRMCGLVMFLP